MRNFLPLLVLMALMGCEDNHYHDYNQQPTVQVQAPPSYAQNIPEQEGYMVSAGVTVSVPPPFRCDYVPTCVLGVAVPSYPEYVRGLGWQCRQGYCDNSHVGLVFHSGYYDAFEHRYIPSYWGRSSGNSIVIQNNYYNKRGPDVGYNPPMNRDEFSSPKAVQPEVKEPIKEYKPYVGTTEVKADLKTGYLKTDDRRGGNTGIVSNDLTVKKADAPPVPAFSTGRPSTSGPNVPVKATPGPSFSVGRPTAPAPTASPSPTFYTGRPQGSPPPSPPRPSPPPSFSSGRPAASAPPPPSRPSSPPPSFSSGRSSSSSSSSSYKPTFSSGRK